MTKILYLKKVFAKIAIFSIKMSESKIFFRLTQATNTYRHISRNIQATMTASWKLAHDKVLKKEFHKKAFKKKKNCIIIKKQHAIALNIYIDVIDTNELVYERRMMMNVFSMTKVFVLKDHLLQNQLYLL